MIISKRKFIKNSLLASAFLITACKTSFERLKGQGGSLSSLASTDIQDDIIKLPKLQYARNALEPYISQNTINYHYGKHHQGYVTNINKMIKGTYLESKTLEEIIKISHRDKNKVAIFNNAAQIWNHNFYWHSMKPKGGGKPSDKLLNKIIADFGSFENFVMEFKTAAISQFGSGWAWLVLENNKLKITRTGNAENPLTTNATALLTIDVWEHAYYLDYQNARPNYIDIFMEHLVNWNFVEQNLGLIA